MYYHYFFLIINVHWNLAHETGIDGGGRTSGSPFEWHFKSVVGNEEDNKPRNLFTDISYSTEWIEDTEERLNQERVDDPYPPSDSSEELAKPVKRGKRAPDDTIPIKIAREKCQEYSEVRYVYKVFGGKNIDEKRVLKRVKDCKNNVETLIIGGAPAKEKEFPHMALIGSQLENEESIQWVCGGSLISNQYVLSAAHCNDPTNPMIVPTWVLLGDLKRPQPNSKIKGNLSRIVLRINHPEYKPPLQDNDIALFKLENPVTLGPTIRPLCLAMPVNSQPTTNKVIVTGWGRTASDEQESDLLLKVLVDRFEASMCVQAYKNEENLFRSGYDAESMICAGRLNETKDTCQGDSGGPLHSKINKPGYDCMWLQEGITSQGAFLCGSGIPSVYTKVSNFLSWIQPIVWPA